MNIASHRNMKRIFFKANYKIGLSDTLHSKN